jgi:hypothetical protein
MLRKQDVQDCKPIAFRQPSFQIALPELPSIAISGAAIAVVENGVTSAGSEVRFVLLRVKLSRYSTKEILRGFR